MPFCHMYLRHYCCKAAPLAVGPSACIGDSASIGGIIDYITQDLSLGTNVSHRDLSLLGTKGLGHEESRRLLETRLLFEQRC